MSLFMLYLHFLWIKQRVSYGCLGKVKPPYQPGITVTGYCECSGGKVSSIIGVESIKSGKILLSMKMW